MNLARASKQNLTDFFRFLARSPATDYVETEGIACWRTPVAHPWFNGLLLRRVPRAGDGERLTQAIAPLRQSSIPFTLWIEWDVPRAPWQPLLAELGFIHDIGAPGMALALADLPAHLALPQGFTILPVTNMDALRTWAHTFVDGYELPAAWADGFFALVAGLGLELPMECFIGLLEGEPVTTSSLFYSADVAGVQFVATRAAVRRQGLGRLMTLFPLYAARARGVDVAILQSSEMGYNLYKSLGFQHVSNVDNDYLADETPGLRN